MSKPKAIGINCFLCYIIPIIYFWYTTVGTYARFGKMGVVEKYWTLITSRSLRSLYFMRLQHIGAPMANQVYNHVRGLE